MATSSAPRGDRGPRLLELLGEVAALDELRHDERQAIGRLADVVDVGDVRMIELRHDARLGEVALGVLGRVKRSGSGTLIATGRRSCSSNAR